MSRCLVVGGCGFIGSHLVDRLLNDGHEVVVLDNDWNGDPRRPRQEAKLVLGSISHKSRILKAMKDVDVVFHMAVLKGTEREDADPIDTTDINVAGTVRVLAAAIESDIKRIVYSSSSEVYGRQRKNLLCEDMISNPQSLVGLQKLMGEQYCGLFAMTHGLEVVSLRYFSVYGLEQPMGSGYSSGMPIISPNDTIAVHGDGRQTCDYVHVNDVVEANVLAADVHIQPGEHLVLNIGTGIATSANEIAHLIGNPVEYVGYVEYLEEREHQVADWSQAKWSMGWEPQIKIADGIKALMGR